MARYVVANRRSGLFTPADKAASKANVAHALNALPVRDVVGERTDEDPLARRVVVVEMNPTEAAAQIAAVGPDVIIEPETFYWIDAVPPIEKRLDRMLEREQVQAAQAVPGNALVLRVTGGGAALPSAEITVFTEDGLGNSRKIKGRTTATGNCRIELPAGHKATDALIIPEGGFWVMIARGRQLAQVIDCPPLPRNGPTDWWHEALNLAGVMPGDGAGIKVGVADTGVWDHPALSHVALANAFIGGNTLGSAQSRDVDSHGTHVSGTIGARPVQAGDYSGLAPGCDLTVSRIFASADSGASNADIANAIDSLSRDHRADLINLSIGGGPHSQLIADAVLDALERGTLCCIAAGNSDGPVEFPGRLPDALAVSALGLAGAYPAGSLAAARLPVTRDRFGRNGLFLANFSCFGPEIAATAPGVGIIAPVPNRISPNPHYGVMDGTSMATPAMCGMLATLLSRDATYLELPRNIQRSTAARTIFARHLRTTGLSAMFEGRGMLSP